MSLSFRLKYFFGLMPTTQQLDAAWEKLVQMRDDLEKIENSAELARYSELKKMVESTDFQHKKREIEGLNFNSSAENRLLVELKNLEKQKSVKQYFQLQGSSDLDRFNRLTGSDKLQNFNDLKRLVESPEFLKRKKEIESINYKTSPEYKLRKDFSTLKKSARLKTYYKTIASSDYLLYMELDQLMGSNSKSLPENDPKVKIYRKFLKSKAYENLKAVENQKLTDKFEQMKHELHSKTFLEREAYLKDKKRYETTPDFAKLSEFRSLVANDDIKFWTKFNKSALYQNYLKMKGSKEIARLEELKRATSTDDFNQKVAYLKNKNRFSTTDEHKVEKEYKELASSKLLSDYKKLKSAKELEFFDKWSLVFEDNFSASKLNSEVWQPENYWGFKMAGTSFSQENELQCYTGLKNVQVNNNTLSIVTKKDNVEGKVWQPAYGLTPKQFNYSSAMLNSGDSFRVQKGVVEAKVKFSIDPSITSAISLTGEKPFPQIDLLRSGKNSVGVGIVDKAGLNASPFYKQIKGLKSGSYHIFRLEITANELVWKVNSYEVFRERFAPAPGGMFMNLVSSLHSPVNEHLLPHYFEVDWIRCFAAKN